MKNILFLFQNFFTNKDFLPPASQLSGTLFTPLHFLFSGILLTLVILSAVYVARRRHLIKPAFIGIWVFLVVFEIVIVTWESLSGAVVGLDLKTNLPLYPCSLFLYAMPFAIWGRGKIKTAFCGYVCTLGLLGAAVNFLYPANRLSTYSCISFVGFHTFLFHGGMLFTSLVMLVSGYHRYTGVTHWGELFLPCIPTLLLSIPANLVNYSPIGADYMFFKGEFPPLDRLFAQFRPMETTLLLYALYIFIPALFYLPSYLRRKSRERCTPELL